MKRYVFTTLRLLIAAAGVGFIVWSLTWTDRMVLPAGHLGAGQTSELAVEVVQRPALTSDGQWHVRLPEQYGGGIERIPRAAVGADASDVRYQPGVLTMLRRANWWLLAAGLVLIAALPIVQSLRWWLLMRCRGLDPGYRKTLRLSLVGLFFNFSLPGMTGGDVVKAYYAAKGSGARTTAVMSVVFDRIAGLMGLIVLAALAGLVTLDHPVVARMTLIVWIVLVGVFVAGHLYLSRTVRGKVGALLRWLSRWLPRVAGGQWLARIDHTAAAYRHHLGTVYLAAGVSIVAHVAQMTATGLAGHALGMEVSLWVLLAVLPVVFFAGCIPISYFGLGVMEPIAIALLLNAPEVTTNQIVGMLLLARLYIVAYALLGALALLRGDIHMFPQQVADVMDEPGHEPAKT